MTPDARRTGGICSSVGGVLVAVTSLGGAASSSSTSVLPGLLFTLWGLVPYALLLAISRFVHDAWTIAGAGVLAIAAEAGIRASVFWFPRGSTAAIALIYSPALIAMLCLPAGALAGWTAGRFWRRTGSAGRTVIVVGAAVAVAWIFVALARPDLLPTTIVRRRATVSRIGSARVLAGADRYELRTLWPASAWYHAAPLPGEHDDSVLVVDRDALKAIDPVTGEVRRTLPLGAALAPKWGWSSTLTALGDRLVVVQQGGGYQNTEVLDLSGAVVWRYRPDPALPPTNMRPADLDGDGIVEFYAAEVRGIVRLDDQGREAPRQAAPQPRRSPPHDA